MRQAPLPREAAELRLWAMRDTLRHRGPDDKGVWSDGRAGLSHARLSIIDLSPAAHQPMASEDGAVWITYNGEVYNFAEIGRDLRALGYRFRSRSDTEIIVNGWHAWGPGIFSRLRGMFALALWDRRSSRLILARDRVGQKPLYYARAGEALLFGSEIKALLAWPDLPRTPDLAAIDAYLSFGYVPAPQTAFAGIEKLPPAHWLSVAVGPDGRLGEPELTCYWALPAPCSGRSPRSPLALENELAARLEEAVRLRLISDVPLGAFLSGGIDSSSVVAMMARAGGGRVKTFSIGFAESDYDERRYARLVADRYATEHEEFVVEPDAAAVLPQLVWHYGEPFADPSAIPTYYVSQMARRRVTVALSGDGGDEGFLGYNRYRAMRWLARLDHLPRPVPLALARALALAPAAMQRRFKLPRVRALLDATPCRPGRRYACSLAAFGDAEEDRVYGEAMAGLPERPAFDLLEPYFAATDSLVAAANRADIATYLPDDLMVKVDVASMAHGLESRAPLLDHELLGWAAALPDRINLARGETKALFKRAMRPFLPHEVLYRRKRGFGLPIDRWFRGPLREMAYDTLLSQSARERGLWRADYAGSLLDAHCRQGRDRHMRLWAMLMLELWYRMWIDASPQSAIRRPAA